VNGTWNVPTYYFVNGTWNVPTTLTFVGFVSGELTGDPWNVILAKFVVMSLRDFATHEQGTPVILRDGPAAVNCL
jgi:hypothetical protein